MARKPVLEGGKRDEIIVAALKLFMEKGYEGTSIRMIQGEVKSEVGLFYYYFKNKDEVFERAMELFFQDYKVQFQGIVEQGYRNPSRALNLFFEYMETETGRFREKYDGKLHWTVRQALREHTLTIIEPYLKEILLMLVSHGAKPKLDLDVAVMFLTHGVGSIILHDDQLAYKAKRNEVVKGVNLIMGLDPETAELLFPYQASPEDIPGWMLLLDKVTEYFPGLDRAAYQQQLVERIASGEAFVVRYRGAVKGAIVISREDSSIEFLARDPETHNFGVGTRLLETGIAQFPIGSRISVVTYREGDPKGEKARKLYRKFGFGEGELIEVLDYPCERLWLTVPESNKKSNG